MSIRRQFATNHEVEINGKKISFAANDDGSIPSFAVARMGGANKKFQEVYAKVWKPHRAAQKAGTVSAEIERENSVMVFVDSCLTGWENVQEDDGAEIKFSRDNAIALLTDLPELLGELQLASTNLDNFLSYQTEVAAKN